MEKKKTLSLSELVRTMGVNTIRADERQTHAGATSEPQPPAVDGMARHIEATASGPHSFLNTEIQDTHILRNPSEPAFVPPLKRMLNDAPAERRGTSRDASGGARRDSEEEKTAGALHPLYDLDENQEDKIDIFKYIGIIIRRKEIIIVAALLMGIVYFYLYMKSPQYYVATARLLYKSIQESIFDENKGYRFNYQLDRELNTHLELLKSKAVLERVSRNLRSYDRPNISGITVQTSQTKGKDNDIIDVIFRHGNRDLAKDVVNEVCKTYPEYLREINSQEDTRLLLKLKIQIDKVQDDLNERENTLRTFKETHRIMQLSGETSLLMNKLSSIDLSLQQTRLSLLEVRERLTTIESQIKQQDITVIQSFTLNDPMKSRLAELELELNTISSEYSPDHYRVKQLTQQIEQLKKAMQNSMTEAVEADAVSRTVVKNPIREQLRQSFISATIEVAALEAKRIAQEQIYSQLKGEMHKLPSLEQSFAFLERETESLVRTLKLLKMKLEETKIKRDSKECEIKILELSQEAAGPIKSKKKSSIMIGLLLGCLIGIVIVFTLELLDQSIKEPSDIEKLIETPLLGYVPFIDTINAIVTQDSLSKTVLEPFRSLRANIKHIAASHNARSFMICSAVKGEGKTTLAANLAITFAIDGKKILLVDCDLRRSHIHSMFNLGKEDGLADYLQNRKTVEEIIKPTAYKNLFVVTSGERPSNPAELLGLAEFSQLLTNVHDRFDFIFCDSPALLPVSDSMIMLPHIHCCIMIFRALWTPIKAAKQAKNQILRIHNNLVGGILNGMTPSRNYYPYYYGYYGYYRYYSYRYTYDYDSEPEKKLAWREMGLTLDKKVKSLVESLLIMIPRYRAIAGMIAHELIKRKLFWFLLLLLGTVIYVHVAVFNTSDGKGSHFKSRKNPYQILYVDTLQGIEKRSGGPGTPAENRMEAANGEYQDTASLTGRNFFGDPRRQTAGDASRTMTAAIVERLTLWVNAYNSGDTAQFFPFYDPDEFEYTSTDRNTILHYEAWHDSFAAVAAYGDRRRTLALTAPPVVEMSQNEYFKTRMHVTLYKGSDSLFMQKVLLWRGVDAASSLIIREKDIYGD